MNAKLIRLLSLQQMMDSFKERNRVIDYAHYQMLTPSKTAQVILTIQALSSDLNREII